MTPGRKIVSIEKPRRYTIHVKLLLHDQVATIREKHLSQVVQSIVSLMKSLNDSLSYTALTKFTAMIMSRYLKRLLVLNDWAQENELFPGQGIL